MWSHSPFSFDFTHNNKLIELYIRVSKHFCLIDRSSIEGVKIETVCNFHNFITEKTQTNRFEFLICNRIHLLTCGFYLESKLEELQGHKAVPAKHTFYLILLSSLQWWGFKRKNCSFGKKILFIIWRKYFLFQMNLSWDMLVFSVYAKLVV